jgi:hypothetical protein
MQTIIDWFSFWWDCLYRAIEAQKERFAPFYGILNYAASACKTVISAHEIKCWKTIEPIRLPTIDWLATGYNNTNTVRTNCDVQFTYRFLANATPSMEIKMLGKKSKPALTEFMLTMDNDFQAALSIEGEPAITKTCRTSDTANCIANVDYILNLLIESQKEEFQ